MNQRSRHGRVRPAGAPTAPAPPSLSIVRGRSSPEPLRWHRVMTARARIAAGYYDRPDVLERLADAVLEELEIP